MAQQKEGGVDGPNRAKGSSPLGTSLFVLLRILDIPFQLYLLRCSSKSSGDSLFSLTPYHACLLGMVIVASARHVFWQLYISEQMLPVPFALMVSMFNSGVNAMNTGMSLWSAVSNAPGGSATVLWGPWTRGLGLALFGLGSFVETYSELQRKDFKGQPANKGKVFMGGLFGFARHVNFGGYLIWRSGFAMFGGGLPWAAVVSSYFLWYFSNLGVPALDEYCSERYGDAWTDFKRRVPYRILPGIM